ncbi:MAG: hypothetical protein R8K50_01435 [Mariprofundus sp.]
MALNIQPVDGLIYRLLQQNSKPASSEARQPASAGADKLNISSQARDQQPMHSVESSLHDSIGNDRRSLESHLLKLYKSNDL